jgi:hypothetical protein
LRRAEALVMPQVAAAAGIAGSRESLSVGTVGEPARAGRLERLALLGQRRVALQALGGCRRVLTEELRDERWREGMRVPRRLPLRKRFGVARAASRGFERALGRRPLGGRLALLRQWFPPVSFQIELLLVRHLSIEACATEQGCQCEPPFHLA